MASNTKFRLAICGGGIGGLTLALVLHKHYKQDIQIDIYEAKDKFAEIGAGIALWRGTWSIMQLLGLDTALEKVMAGPPDETPRPSFAFRRGDQFEESENFHRMVISRGPVTLHRTDMLDILVDNLPPNVRTHFLKRLSTYSEDTSGAIQLVFADGSCAEADILVGADGINSATRRSMYLSLAKEADEKDAKILAGYAEARWTGTYAYRTIVDTDALLKIAPGHRLVSTPVIYLGKDKHIVSFPISRGRFLNLIGFVTVPEGEGAKLEGPSVKDVPKDEMTENFVSTWEPEIRQLMSCVERSSRWAIHHVRNLPQYTSGRVVLLGDAAHGMTTHLGAGAAQAIEDAFILGRLLAHKGTNNENIKTALKVYEDVRLPIANAMVERSWNTGLLYEFIVAPGGGSWCGVEPSSAEGLGMIAGAIDDAWSWQSKELPQVDWLRAEEQLCRLIRSQASFHGSGIDTDI